MTKRLALALSCLAATLAVPAAAQEATVLSGLVTTRDDGLPLPGATVSIDALKLSAVTDAEGRYKLTVPAGTVRSIDLRVTAPGLTAKTVAVTLSPGSMTQNVALGLGFHEEITVGSRAAGAEAEKAVPVDILTQKQIELTGAVETMQVIQALAPSFNFPRPTVSDGTDSIRPATLRGLGPDHVLVLVNGKRRHPTALVHINNTIGRGATGVDLNAIPVSAIEKIEILRDGAAAQYGSDAIAGVINIVLKSGATPFTLSGRGGLNKGSYTEVRGAERDFSDGGTYDASGSYGTAVGPGTLSLSAEFRRRDGTNRAGLDTRDQVRAGDALKNAVQNGDGSTPPNSHWGDSEENDVLTFANLDMPLNAGDTAFFYAFGGYSHRTGVHGGNPRRAIDANNWPQIYPLGFLPLIEPKINDASATAGFRGTRSKWFWDVSAEYGHNRLDYYVTNSSRPTTTASTAEPSRPTSSWPPSTCRGGWRSAWPGRSTWPSAPSCGTRTSRSWPASPTPGGTAALATSSGARPPRRGSRCSPASAPPTRPTRRAATWPATWTSRATSRSSSASGPPGASSTTTTSATPPTESSPSVSSRPGASSSVARPAPASAPRRWPSPTSRP
ncbi:MAG: hypothetical protein DMF81_04810 [Acidobacteria bacterium]|nr:MAG: hypothetical protein DMF81_04810 [Acidobacteriota bacterium]